MISDWITTLTLIFGGCCSNALTLEQITSKYPDSGSLITFFQFLLITVMGLPRHLTFSGGSVPYPRLKPRKIPLTPYLIQVALFYAVSLLNNMAFGYQIPMPVHIIFRSGGLIVSMLLGYLIVGKRYTFTQVFSVITVTFGVVLTTLSASRPRSSMPRSDVQPSTLPIHFNVSYAMGITILSVALILSGLLGLVQDWTYRSYASPPSNGNAHKVDGSLAPSNHKEVPTWQESMFYLHFLATPMFIFLRHDLSAQFRALHSGPKFMISLSPSALCEFFKSALPYPLVHQRSFPTSYVEIPVAYAPLFLNTLTQLLCASGVHKLTGKLNSLTVTLTLVVRKAVSLVISVLVYADADARGNVKMWVGAGLVLLGTVGYSVGGKKEKEKEE